MSNKKRNSTIVDAIDDILSIENKDLLIHQKQNDVILNSFVCKNCIDLKTKKTRRLLFAIKGEKNLQLKIVHNDNDEGNENIDVIKIHVKHPLFEDDVYELFNVSSLIQFDTKEKNDDNENDKRKILGYIYVLELEQNKYYIGKSSKPLTRTGDHVASTIFDDKLCKGSGWTKMYKPNKILDISSSYDEFDEDLFTLRYMKKYGMDNVRGGSFCELNLNKENINTLIKMMAGAEDRCYYCGELDHYINDCKQRNLKRVPQKQKKLQIKSKDMSKAKIMKFYGTTKLLENSDLKKIKENIKDDNDKDDKNIKFPCKYCNKSFQTLQNKSNHENILCTKNEKVKRANMIEADVDAILEKNKHYLKDKKKHK